MLDKGDRYEYEWLEEVKKSGIRGKKNVATDMQFSRLEIMSGFKYLHAEGETTNREMAESLNVYVARWLQERAKPMSWR